MMEKTFFSVIVPVYNAEKYLADCMGSVLRQDFSDYEIVLVNDGSQDGSGQICDAYRAKYPDRIRVLHKENQGQLSARLAGLRLAVGQYICFLDSDDCLADNALRKLHQVIADTRPDVVLFRWRCIDEISARDRVVPKVFPESGPVEKKAVFERMLSTSVLNSLCIKCCRRELFDVDTDYSGYYSIRNGEDLIQSLPVLYRGDTFYYLTDELYLYRLHAASVTHVYRKGQLCSVNATKSVFYEYLVKMGLDTPENREIFLRSYLLSVWRNMEAMYRDAGIKGERDATLDEIRGYDFVKQARVYVDSSGLPLPERLALSVFYQNDNRKLNAYMKIYPLLRKIQRGIARLFG